jgi:hypothetical protein
MPVQVLASAEICTWNAVAYAVSQLRITWHTVTVTPKSICSHCGSLNAEDHREPVLPSTAALAGVPAFSVDEAVAVLPCAALTEPQPALPSSPKTWNSQSE